MEDIDLKELFMIFWNKKIQIILFIILFAIIGGIYTIGFIKPMYTASTTLVLATSSGENTQDATNSITTTDVTLNSKLVSTYSELVKSKNGNEYLKVVKEEVKEKRQKDMPTRLNARRKMMRKLNKVKDSDGKNIDVPAKLFNEIAPKYAGSNVGGYTRIVKAGPRRGDGAEVAVLQLI